MTSLRSIDFSKEKYFECGGKKFYIRESLSFTRYKEMQKIMVEFGFSATFDDIFKKLKESVESYNKLDFFNMSVTIYKILEGVKDIQTKDDPALRLCALFIDEENEDPTKYDESQMKAKIDCWGSELEVGPFFYLATSLVPTWMYAYQAVIRNGLNMSQEQKK